LFEIKKGKKKEVELRQKKLGLGFSCLKVRKLLSWGFSVFFLKRWETRTKVRENLRRWRIRCEAVKVKKVNKWQFNTRLRNEMDTWLVMLGRKKMCGLNLISLCFVVAVCQIRCL